MSSSGTEKSAEIEGVDNHPYPAAARSVRELRMLSKELFSEQTPLGAERANKVLRATAVLTQVLREAGFEELIQDEVAPAPDVIAGRAVR